MSTPSTFTVFNSMSLQEILSIKQSQTPSDAVWNKLAGAFKQCSQFRSQLSDV